MFARLLSPRNRTSDKTLEAVGPPTDLSSIISAGAESSTTVETTVEQNISSSSSPSPESGSSNSGTNSGTNSGASGASGASSSESMTQSNNPEDVIINMGNMKGNPDSDPDSLHLSLSEKLQQITGGIVSSSMGPGQASQKLHSRLSQSLRNSISQNPENTVASALEALQDVVKQPLTGNVREVLSQLIQTLKQLQTAVKSNGSRISLSSGAGGSRGTAQDPTTNALMMDPTTDTLATTNGTTNGGVTAGQQQNPAGVGGVSTSASGTNLTTGGAAQVFPREKLRDLYDEGLSQAQKLKWEISSTYKEAPALRDFLLQRVNTTHDMLRVMYRALSDRLTVQTALQSLKDFSVSVKDTSLSISCDARDSLLAICNRCIEIFAAMLQRVPGYENLKKLHDAAFENLTKLKEKVRESLMSSLESAHDSSSQLTNSLKKKLMHRLEICTEFLNAVKDRMLKSQSLYLALDTLDDIERQVVSMYGVGLERLKTAQRDAQSKLGEGGSSLTPEQASVVNAMLLGDVTSIGGTQKGMMGIALSSLNGIGLSLMICFWLKFLLWCSQN